jgi:glycosyltransferase involved in cell wall biosynthesis
LDGQKGNSYLLEAAAQVLRKGHRMKCMLVGDGPLLDELKEQCAKEGIEKDVIFTGYYANIPLIQSMIDIQVFPSLFEGTPLTLFEAMSMRLAIISTNVDGLGEILRHEKNALLVSPKNPEQLAAAIEDLLVNPAKADYLAHRAQRDSKNFDIQRTIDCLQNIYDSLLN